MARSARTLITGALSALFVAVPATAQAADPTDVLKGPEVSERRAKSLVAETMTGRMVLPEGRPELAAFELLDVPHDLKERARQLGEERLNTMAFALVDEIDLVREITDRLTAGETAEARELQRELRDRIEPDMPRSPMLAELSDLAGEHAPELRSIVDEYWSVRIDRALADRDPDNAKARARVEQRLSEELFLREVRRAYEQSLQRYRQALDAIYNAVDPTPEQRAQIRSLVIEHIKQTRLEPTLAERRGAMRRIYDLLDEPRRAKLFDYAMLIALPGD